MEDWSSGLRVRVGEVVEAKDWKRWRMSSPNGPKECTMGSFSSSCSERSSGDGVGEKRGAAVRWWAEVGVGVLCWRFFTGDGLAVTGTGVLLHGEAFSSSSLSSSPSELWSSYTCTAPSSSSCRKVDEKVDTRFTACGVGETGDLGPSKGKIIAGGLDPKCINDVVLRIFVGDSIPQGERDPPRDSSPC